MKIPPIDHSIATGVTPLSRSGASVQDRFAVLVTQLTEGERFMDRVIDQARRGKDFGPAELIAIQAGVYRYSQQLEAFSKLVDKTTGAIRRTLETSG